MVPILQSYWFLARSVRIFLSVPMDYEFLSHTLPKRTEAVFYTLMYELLNSKLITNFIIWMIYTGGKLNTDNTDKDERVNKSIF